MGASVPIPVYRRKKTKNVRERVREYVGIGDLIRENDQLRKSIANAKETREKEEMESVKMMETLDWLMGKHQMDSPTSSS